ncbi:MAG: phosphoglycolate phosphatase [Geminicoccaceae bacterium]
MSVAAVVFDLDGTLVDTLPDLHAAVRVLLAEAGLDAPSAPEVRAMIGDGARRLVERSLAWANAPVDAAGFDKVYERFLEIYNAAPCRESRLYAHVEPTLKALAAQGVRLAVCTNKPQAPTEAILETLGVSSLFGAAIGGDAVPKRKPDPAHLQAVLDRLAVDPAATVMVGDSHNDLAAAQGLGMPCILVDYGYTVVPARELGADRVIGDFAELEAALAELPTGG